MTGTPIVSFTEFCSDLLPDWVTAAPITADDTAPTALDTAKLALFRAATTKELGTILVVAPAGEHRAISDFINAMVQGQALLAGVHDRIVIATPERALLTKDAVVTIVLSPSAGAPESVPFAELPYERQLDLLARALHIAVGPECPQSPAMEMVKAYAQERAALVAARIEAMKTAEVESEWVDPNVSPDAYKKPTSGVPGISLKKPEFPPGCDERGYYTPDAMRAGEEIRTAIRPEISHRAITSTSPRWRRR